MHKYKSVIVKKIFRFFSKTYWHYPSGLCYCTNHLRKKPSCDANPPKCKFWVPKAVEKNKKWDKWELYTILYLPMVFVREGWVYNGVEEPSGLVAAWLSCTHWLSTCRMLKTHEVSGQREQARVRELNAMISELWFQARCTRHVWCLYDPIMYQNWNWFRVSNSLKQFTGSADRN